MPDWSSYSISNLSRKTYTRVCIVFANVDVNEQFIILTRCPLKLSKHDMMSLTGIWSGHCFC